MQARDAGRRQVDLDAERRQHVGGARARGQRPVAVLGDRHAGAGDDEGGAGGDVVGARGRRRRCRRRRSRRAAPRPRSILARMAETAPVISPTVSPRTRSAIRKRAHLRRASPRRTSSGSKTCAASSRGQRGAGRDLADQLPSSGSSVALLPDRRRRPLRDVPVGGEVEEVLAAARGRARRRCSRDGTARRGPAARGASGP